MTETRLKADICKYDPKCFSPANWSGPGFTDHLTSAIMRMEVCHGKKKTAAIKTAAADTERI